ncbi:hypothetical protein [Chondromyces crocatus]|uniref:Lipoprotein n=1 Tax=Chondromyces crocatus TaxID=52 RepID=A0A0K1EEY5_CHOCO|nr:hypothetical protein [Chondromyces crocatus]AKT39435.1 uncharacterized protein CMC5_035820 [Chondromyces crocatus]
MSYRFAMVFLSALALAACGGDEHGHEQEHEHETEDGDDHACEHLEEGPFQSVTAAEVAASAPALAQTHVSYEVALVEDGAGSFHGLVTFTPREAAEFAFFSTEEVAMAFQDADGAAVAPESACSTGPCSAGCALVKSKVTVDLETATYTLTLGPTTLEQVHVLVEKASHAH